MTRAPAHVPVLLDVALAALAPVPGETIIDGTFGAGGYARALLGAGARVVAIDRDPAAAAAGRPLAAAHPGRLDLVEGCFSAMAEIVASLGLAAVDGVALDLGVSSMQLDTPERGFSFRFDGPLDMRMGGEGPTAADILARASEETIAAILYRYGEERRSRRIAAAVVERRRSAPFLRTADFAALVERVVGRAPGERIHPATRSFQALRIAVNRELEEVAQGLAAAERILRPGGRLAVVTFHSLEDRIVKTFLAERAGAPASSRHLPPAAEARPTFELASRRPAAPDAAEVAANPRARSAKLRAARRLAGAPRPLDLAALGVPRLDDLLRGGRA